ncbi:MAG TPA: elongation factor P [Chloroflexi bacterium]|nr:MAG: elongation factor P [Anaerolineaceae bacterium 4572_5.2]HEY84833.1 elongation factor P [Chloroflexota bacterium]
MIDANKLRKGTTFTDNDNLYKVIDYSHQKMARGGATIKTKVINLRSGSITEKTFNSGEKVKDIHLDHEDVQYLYSDGNLYYFMNTETYEQPALSKEILADIIPYLVDGLVVKLSTYNGEALDVELPTTIEMEVIDAEPGYAGDTATGANKAVTVSSGLEVQTPLFINIGDVIRIDTRTGNYLTRV